MKNKVLNLSRVAATLLTALVLLAAKTNQVRRIFVKLLLLNTANYSKSFSSKISIAATSRALLAMNLR